ncbi:DMT family transporter [Fundicoccus ignavus]|uniref:EamA family transporter n=1 Tax=Fundicoccus ignavus TaxID=2664442 RepID=A0A844BYY0_9LACT|nr:DMT family transporter [Fundicoccus ignavus]MRJ47194.1 EamA family transporter [Fundicoccus ignavus]
MTNRRKGQLGLILVAIIWGSGFVMSSVALNYFSTIHILALRFSIAFISMLVIFHRQLKHINKSTMIRGGILGVILYLAFYFQTIGLVHTTASKNAFLTAFNVVLVPIFGALFLKKKLTPLNIIGSLSAIIGVGVMSLNEFGAINIGDVLTLICALFFALQIIYTSLYVSDENPYALNTVQMGVATLCGMIISLIQDQPIEIGHANGIIAVVYLGVVSTMLAFLLQTTAQRYTTETETVIIMSMEAVFGMVFSAMLLNEEISIRMLIGAALILAGVLIVQLKPRRKQQESV